MGGNVGQPAASSGSVRVFDLGIDPRGVKTQDLVDAGYPVLQDLAPRGEVSPDDLVMVPPTRTAADVAATIKALQLQPLPGARPAFRPGPTATVVITEQYLTTKYGGDVDKIASLVERYSSVQRLFHPDEHQPGDVDRESGMYNYEPHDAIELARELARRVQPDDLPLLSKAFDRYVPVDDGRRPGDEAQRRDERDTFIDTFRAELQRLPQYPR